MTSLDPKPDHSTHVVGNSRSLMPGVSGRFNTIVKAKVFGDRPSSPGRRRWSSSATGIASPS